MQITSPAFSNNQNIPSKYTCHGEDINPPLKFRDVPKDAESLCLIVDDPDAPGRTFTHWVLYDIQASITSIDENSTQGLQGVSDFGKVGYGGPCPPSGVHRYFFKLYALDNVLNLPEGATKQEVEKAMKDHIIASAQIVGLYSRS